MSRRTALTFGFTGLAAASLGLTGDATSTTQDADPVPFGNLPNVSIERVHSQARNREVDLLTIYPEGIPREGLPVCLVLHGRYGDARNSAAGLPAWLSAAVARGAVPPFALLAVDGGSNSYWHRVEGDDPMWMLIDEVPRWLGERGLGGEDGQPFGVCGISMGGFGALVYTRRRNEHRIPLRSTAVVSPALVTDWSTMRKRGAFANEADWAELDPLRHVGALGDVPLGVWCGTSDRFIKGARRFIDLANPEVASTTPGGHNSRYYRKALPEMIRFVGDKVPDSPAETR
ncbi:alpha/beta hydrolase [Parasphingorhabdus pacifica]